MMGSVLILFLLWVLEVSPLPVQAENWPRWRGSNGNAVSTASSLPLRWSSTENVRWKVRIPGEGFSSPIVWEERIFRTSAQDGGKRRLVHCLDRKDGKTLWSGEISDENPEQTSSMTGHAAATPVTDGRRVVAFFGNAGVICYDVEGKKLWQRSLGKFDSELGLASSPVLYHHLVILVCDHDGSQATSFDSFLIALDVRTGTVAWKTDRRGLYRSWSTPILVPAGGDRQELVVSAQDQLRGYDPETGKELWRAGGMTGWVAPSPVFGHGLVYATSGKDGPTLAIRPGGKGDVTATHVVWQNRRGGPYVCSPLLYGSYLYVHNEQRLLSCYHALTGKRQYQERMEGKFYASSAAGDGKLYFTNDSGTTFVIKAGPSFERLARNDLGEYTLASPAFSRGELFLRTEQHLYCIAPRITAAPADSGGPKPSRMPSRTGPPAPGPQR
jgi:outer membrane protein assembly factor BamB